MTHLHRSAGDRLRPESAEGAEFFPWISGELRAGREVVFGSLDELPAAAGRDRANAGGIYGIKSGAMLPLSAGDDLPLGVLTFADLERERAWDEDTLRRLRLV